MERSTPSEDGILKVQPSFRLLKYMILPPIPGPRNLLCRLQGQVWLQQQLTERSMHSEVSTAHRLRILSKYTIQPQICGLFLGPVSLTLMPFLPPQVLSVPL